MIVKENGLRYAKLIHVSVDNGKTDNSNKVYIMEELPDGRIKCEYGRVGKSLTVEYKPKSKWESVYKQKIGKSKGYTDVTEFIVSENVNSQLTTKEIEDNDVNQLIVDLINYANKTIKKNYKVSQDSVSENQVKKAQELINEIKNKLKLNADLDNLNKLLISLYTIIPRKMDNVKNYLFTGVNTISKLKIAEELIENEQSILDTMAGQVQLLKSQHTKTSDNSLDEKTTILEQIGVKIEIETNKETLDLVKKLLGDNVSRAKKIFKVINTKTQIAFDTHVKKASVKKRRLYFHGSRNENWFNIIQSGLLIRPSGAVHTGSMFGDGIYFADKAKKSIGYTSLKGSHWAKGTDNKGYLALYDVHLGKQKEITNHTSDCYSLSEKILKKEGFDSVFAKGGYDLINNEYIIYNTNQCTITHLIEIN